MRLPALKHLAEAVRALAHSERIRVLGSSALLPSFPQLGEAGQPLEVSFDADLLVEPCDEQLAAMLHEAVGEGSLFSRQTGYHADILRQQITETLSPGWEQRLVPLGIAGDVAALAPVDVAVVKLRVGREKDLALCRHLLRARLLAAESIQQALDATPMPEREIVLVYQRWREVSAK